MQSEVGRKSSPKTQPYGTWRKLHWNQPEVELVKSSAIPFAGMALKVMLSFDNFHIGIPSPWFSSN